MAVYINNRRFVDDKTWPGGRGEVIDYFVDTAADIALLPDNTKIKESSTALVITTSEVYTLTSTGWEMIA